MTKTNRQRAPIMREKVFEIKTLKNSPTSNLCGYCQLYRCQGEKKVFSNRGMEKKLDPKEIKFCQTCSKNLSFSSKCHETQEKNILLFAIMGLDNGIIFFAGCQFHPDPRNLPAPKNQYQR